MDSVSAQIVLRKERERSLLRRHPWIFSGAVDRVEGPVKPGMTCRVVDFQGNFLAYAAYSPNSKIAARVWSFSENEVPDESFFERRIESAFQLRKTVFGSSLPDAYRLIHSESDFFPGVTCDIYNGFAVCQLSSAGADLHRETLTRIFQKYAPDGVYERSDLDSRVKEGLAPRSGLLAGAEPPDKITFTENGIRYQCDVRTGHKTGFYLDQRLNRLAVRQMMQGRQSVLNCFCYTGGFGLAAAAGGAAHVCNVDVSADALNLAHANAEMNGFSPDQFETVEADVFQYLRTCRDSRKTFDAIILDPPKFAETAASVDRAARGYKDINLLAMKLLQPGGLLFTFSCSGAMDDALFGKVVDSAAADSKADFRIVQWLSQGPDHPVSASFPEGRYLKGLVLQKI